jgi:hypothetical protein
MPLNWAAAYLASIKQIYKTLIIDFVFWNKILLIETNQFCRDLWIMDAPHNRKIKIVFLEKCTVQKTILLI